MDSSRGYYFIKSDRLLLYLLLLIYVILYSILDINQLSFPIAIGSILVYVVCIVSLKKSLIDPLGCTGVVLLYFFLSHFGLSIVHALFGVDGLKYPSRTIDFLSSVNYPDALVLANIAMLSYTIAATRKQSHDSHGYNAPIINDATNNVIFFIGSLLLIYSFIVMLVMFLRGQVSASMDYKLYREAAFSNPFYSYMIVLYSFGGCFIFSVAERRQFIFAGVLFGLTAIMLLITGNRGEVLFPSLAIYAILRVRKIYFKKIFIVLGVIALIIIIPFISSARHAGGWVQLFQIYSSNFFSSILDTFSEIGIQIRLTVYILNEYVAGTRKLLWGYSYYECFLRWFRWILPTKISDFVPKSFNFRSEYSTMGFNQVAESFANFGLLGVVAFHYIIGGFMGKREKTINRPIDVAILGACCSVFINMTRNKFSFVPTHLLFIFAFYLLIRVITKISG
ncbi:MAG: O-antigen polysaccharide polymerase Wzy [Lachnospiraceae bacterium]|nr:O-antigen polysaccharide polymerase Wzy [Lachnospiraceae bacterium]